MQSPKERYQKDLANADILYDSAQEKAVCLLEDLYQALKHPVKKLLPWQKIPRPKGVYLWGGVGVGKTYLMDLFFESLPFPEKRRLHFHQFMQEVHHALKSYQGQKDPLKLFAKALAKKTRILCFDEFFVNDIADAMILVNVFEALFKEGLILVATSNVQPDNLYRNGLQRSKFLPAIALIKEQMIIEEVLSNQDYRLRQLTQAGVYFSPLDEVSSQKMQNLFLKLCHNEVLPDKSLEVNQRSIDIIARSHNIVWFAFNKLCHSPRSHQDYLVIAQNFQTVFLSDVPLISKEDHNSITYFIHLIDILYDANVNLILSSAGSIEQIYAQGNLQFEYQRTRSRLQEMQSKAYLHSAHRALT